MRPQAFNVGASLLVATTDLDPDTISFSHLRTKWYNNNNYKNLDHGYSVGDFVVIDFTAGSATDGNYENHFSSKCKLLLPLHS